MSALLDPELIVFGQLALAAFLGMLVGTERVAAGKSAGTRTFALVSLGACLFVVVGTLANQQYVGVVNFDPMRISAAVVMGIGFLGGGLIFLQGKSIQGLTTSAGLWVAAGIGMAVGFELYAISIFTSFLTLIVFTFMWLVENWLKKIFERMRLTEISGDSEIDQDRDSMSDSEERFPPTIA